LLLGYRKEAENFGWKETEIVPGEWNYFGWKATEIVPGEWNSKAVARLT
jgi:hypothetical protein